MLIGIWVEEKGVAEVLRSALKQSFPNVFDKECEGEVLGYPSQDLFDQSWKRGNEIVGVTEGFQELSVLVSVIKKRLNPNSMNPRQLEFK